MSPSQVCQETILCFSDLRMVLNLQLEYVKKCRLRSICLKKRWQNMLLDCACILWMKRYNVKGFTIKTFHIAVDCGNLELVQWLHDHGVVECTAEDGYLPIPYGKNLLDIAAFEGHLRVVQWLHENRQEGCTKNAMDWAAMNGHLEVVQWLHKNRREGCTKDAMDWAAMNGHLEVVQWLHENRREGCKRMQ